MTKHQLNYEFAEQGSSDDEGYNDPLRTHFDVNVASSVARESLQNVIDAHDRRSGKPAKAVFSLFKIKPSAVPGRDRLVEILESCREYWPASLDAKRFTESAVRDLESAAKISVLRISDYNTVGLTGDDGDRNGNYHNFMKAAGATNKTGNTGGSFGLGKGALFAASRFSTIFVRSRFGRGKSVGHLFQGKCRFMSHKDGRVVRRAVGSFGLQGQMPVRDPDLIPPEFERDQNGTDIYILGFRNEETWVDDILGTVLHNFWRAIQKGELEVEVDKYQVTKKNLGTLMHEKFKETDEGTDDRPNPLPYFLAYTEPSGRKGFEKTLPTLGKVQCYLLPREGYPNRVACFRKTGMLIQLKMFHSPLVRFAGVFLCENDKGNEILKVLEPPSHDKWDKNSSNAKTPEGKPRRECSVAEREFETFVRECVRTLAATDNRKQMAIGGLEQYLSLPADEDELLETLGPDGVGNVKPSSQESGMEGAATDSQLPYVPAPQQLRVSKANVSGNDVPGEATIPSGGGRRPDPISDPKPNPWPIPGKDERPGTAGGGDIRVQIVSNASYRSFCVDDPESGTVHIVVVRGAAGDRCHLRVMAGTDNSYDAVRISKAVAFESGKELTVSGNFVRDIPVGDSGETKVKLKFPGDEWYSLNVGVYEDL